MEKQEKTNTNKANNIRATDDMKQRIDELRAGYNNAQELIRFMDTKLAFVSTLCCAIIGGIQGTCAEICKRFFGEATTFYSWLGIIVVILFFICSIATVLVMIFGVLGRKKSGKTSLPSPHILFPIGNPHDLSVFKEQINSRTKDAEYNEVCYQLHSVGIILEKKMNASRWAIYFLFAQILFGFAVILLRFFWIRS